MMRDSNLLDHDEQIVHIFGTCLFVLIGGLFWRQWLFIEKYLQWADIMMITTTTTQESYHYSVKIKCYPSQCSHVHPFFVSCQRKMSSALKWKLIRWPWELGFVWLDAIFRRLKKILCLNQYFFWLISMKKKKNILEFLWHTIKSLTIL